MSPASERRQRRSEISYEALQLQLRATARRECVESLVLVDFQGLVIAQSRVEEPDAAEVAALSPRLAQARPWVGTMRCRSGRRNVTISPFRLGRETAYLCAVGVRSSRQLPQLLQTRDGVRRILRGTAPRRRAVSL